MLSLPSPTVPGSILAKLAWLVAATYYYFPRPLRLTPVTGAGQAVCFPTPTQALQFWGGNSEGV